MEKRNPFIGLRRKNSADLNFHFVSNDAPVLSSDEAVFDAAVVDDTSLRQVVAIIPPGNTWQRINPPPEGEEPETRSFICQYITV